MTVDVLGELERYKTTLRMEQAEHRHTQAELRTARAEILRRGSIMDNALAGWQADQTRWFKSAAELRAARKVVEAATELLTMYPADIFTGDSGDPAPIRIVALRAALAEYEEATK